MGKRGPKPKPTYLKLLEGNPGKQAVPRKEPKPEGVGRMPGWLHEIAKRFWRRRAPELERLGLLTASDSETFAAVCQDYALWQVAEKELAKGGAVLTAKNSGYEMPSPWVAIAKQRRDAFVREASAFGMTPSGRVGLVAKGDVKKNAAIEALENKPARKRPAR